MVLWPPQLVWQSVFLAMSLRRKSPTMPRTPPSGFRNAVMRPNLIASSILSGTSPRAMICANWWKTTTSRSHSKSGLRCSAVMPDGPPVAPRRAVRRFFMSNSGSRLICSAGSNASNSGSKGNRGKSVLFSGFVSSCRVLNVPGPLLHPPKLAVQKTVLQDGPTSPLDRPFSQSHHHLAASVCEWLPWILPHGSDALLHQINPLTASKLRKTFNNFWLSWNQPTPCRPVEKHSRKATGTTSKLDLASPHRTPQDLQLLPPWRCAMHF